jgi:anti-anti-sigma factor
MKLDKITEPKIVIKQSLAKAVNIAITGVIDGYTSTKLEKLFDTLFRQKNYNLFIDMSRVDYISCSGVGIFIGALGVSKENHGNIIVMNPNPYVLEIFDLLGVMNIFPVSYDLYFRGDSKKQPIEGKFAFCQA